MPSFMPSQMHVWPMRASVQASELEGVAIAERRYETGGLTLVPEGGAPCSVVCPCGRSHWLATTKERARQVVLYLVCHSCQRRYDFTYTGSLPP